METTTKDRADVRTKTFRAEVKADVPAAGATTGTFEARVAAFGNVDLQGDRIEPEAFDATLASWSDSGDSIPVIWSHQWDDPMAHIGVVDEASASAEGLEVRGTIDLDTPLGKQVHRLMVDRRVKEFSFAYLPTDAAPDPDDDRVRVLRGLDLIEVGPTLKGANPETVLYGAKSAIASHGSGTSDADWDASAATSRLPNSSAALVAAHAWRDPDGDPDAKSTYKFPHHEVGEDGRVGAANLRGSSSGIGVLNGGRGGAAIPDGDRKGVYDHLARHLRDGDRDVPELRSLDADEDEDEGGAKAQTCPECGAENPDDATECSECGAALPGSGSGSGDEKGWVREDDLGATEVKYGRVLSKANEAKLREAGELISAVLASLRDTGSADDGASDDGKSSSADRSEPRTIDRTDAALRVLELGG
jgi:HK97 family phage prohead protease